MVSVGPNLWWARSLPAYVRTPHIPARSSNLQGAGEAAAVRHASGAPKIQEQELRTNNDVRPLAIHTQSPTVNRQIQLPRFSCSTTALSPLVSFFCLHCLCCLILLRHSRGTGAFQKPACFVPCCHKDDLGY